MNLKRTKFVDFYLGKANGNAAEAARLAGYADPEREGYRLKNAPEISAEILRLLTENTLSAPEVLVRHSDQARGTLEPFLSIGTESVSVDLSTDAAQANLHLIKKIKTKRRTGGKEENAWEEFETEIELHDPQAALVQLGRYWKMFTDKVENTGDPDKPIIVKVLSGVRMADLR